MKKRIIFNLLALLIALQGLSQNVGIGTATPMAQFHTTGTVRFQNYSSGASGAILRTNNTGDLSITNFTGSTSDVLRGDGTFGTISTGITGTVSSTATILNGSGFTVTSPSTGVYNVTFSTALPSISSVTASIVTNYGTTPVYCSALSNCVVGNINSFVFNGVTTITNSGTGCAGGGYANYTGFSANVNAGSPYTFSMQSDGFWNPEYWAMWVDWNQDGDFNDAGEDVWNSGGNIWNPSGSITVPITALNGTTRLRVRTSNGGIPGTGVYSGACGYNASWDYGEVEDYTLIVSGGVSPFGVAHVSNLSTSGCTIVTTSTSGIPNNMSFSFQAK